MPGLFMVRPVTRATLSCLLATWLVVAGCQAGLAPAPVRSDDEGALYVYLQPLARDADRLRAGIVGVAAVHADGREFPLRVALRELRGGGQARQRLLAAGALPPGEYVGLSVRTGRATLAGDQGQSALLSPDTPTRTDFGFTVQRREGRVIALVLRYAASVDAGFRFSPVFSAYVPERPPVGLMGFVANRGSDDVTAFNKKTLEVFDVVATGKGPAALALDPRTRRVHVALAGEDAIEVIDLLAGRVADRIRLTPGDEPVWLALTPDGRTLLSANRGSNTISLIDPVSRFERGKIAVGNGPRAVVVEPAGRRAFVPNTLSNTVSVVDIAGRSLIRDIPTDPGPVQAQFNRRGDRLYVTHELVRFVTVVNPATMTVTGRLPIRAALDVLKIDPGTDLIYLGSRRELAVGVYDPLSFAAVDFVDTGSGVAHMAMDGEENTLYLVSPDTNRVLVSHRIRKRVVGEIEVGDGPSWVSVVGEQ